MSPKTTQPPERERREHTRAPIELRVEYTRLNAFFADYTKNISKGGTFIKTAQPLTPGTEFVFKLFVPSLAEPLSLRGRVVRVVAPGEQGEDAGMGIRFLYEDEAERLLIEGVAERLMKDSLGQHVYDQLTKKR